MQRSGRATAQKPPAWADLCQLLFVFVCWLNTTGRQLQVGLAAAQMRRLRFWEGKWLDRGHSWPTWQPPPPSYSSLSGWQRGCVSVCVHVSTYVLACGFIIFSGSPLASGWQVDWLQEPGLPEWYLTFPVHPGSSRWWRVGYAFQNIHLLCFCHPDKRNWGCRKCSISLRPVICREYGDDHHSWH